MKYIVVRVTPKSNIGGKSTDPVREFPFIFPTSVVHADMAHQARCILSTQYPNAKFEVVGAGEISLWHAAGRTANCHGESTSLKVKSRKERDTELIKWVDYHHGLIDGFLPEGFDV